MPLLPLKLQCLLDRCLLPKRLPFLHILADLILHWRLVEDYFRLADELLAKLDHDNHALAVDIASVPEHIRGYGHVKERHLADALKRQDDLLVAWRDPRTGRAVA